MKGVFRGMGAARKALQQAQADSKVLQYLDKQNLGFLPRRKQRKAAWGNQQHSEPLDTTVPFPFNTTSTKAKLLLQAQSFSDVQLKLGDVEAPEVAFVGRSNSGKSTLINSLLNLNPSHMQHSTTSNRPGETKDLIFYGTGPRPKDDPALILCDMPGYGFAFMSEEDKLRCQELIHTYLRVRGANLKRVLLLVDARYGFKPADVEFLKSITGTSMRRAPWKMQVILTKCDIVERPMLARRIAHTREHLNELLRPIGGSKLPVLMVAAKKKHGLVSLQKELAALCPRAPASQQTSKPSDLTKPADRKEQSRGRINDRMKRADNRWSASSLSNSRSKYDASKRLKDHDLNDHIKDRFKNRGANHRGAKDSTRPGNHVKDDRIKGRTFKNRGANDRDATDSARPGNHLKRNVESGANSRVRHPTAAATARSVGTTNPARWSEQQSSKSAPRSPRRRSTSV